MASLLSVCRCSGRVDASAALAARRPRTQAGPASSVSLAVKEVTQEIGPARNKSPGADRRDAGGGGGGGIGLASKCVISFSSQGGGCSDGGSVSASVLNL